MSAKRILLIEDNAVNRRLAQFLLKSQGYEVWEVTNATEAFASLKEKRPDLILMDIQLPGMDGLELTRQLKGASNTRDILIIALTAYAMKADEERALAAGCDAYVSKPIDVEALPRVIERLLQSGGR